MKWQDFGKIKKDKFAAAAESGRQPCGCLSPTARRVKWRGNWGSTLGEMYIYTKKSGFRGWFRV